MTSLGRCDDTKNPKAFDDPTGSEHPVTVDRASTTNATPIPPLRMIHLPGATGSPDGGLSKPNAYRPCSRGHGGWSCQSGSTPRSTARMPGMLHVRPARPDDAGAVAAVHVRSWQVGYRGLLPDAYLEGLRPEDRMDHYTFGATDPEVPSTMVAAED